jgi:broad specificity phosphatase PhoE
MNQRILLRSALVVVASLIAIIVWRWWFCYGATTFLIVRHADRLDNQDALNAAGVTRAQQLVRVAEEAGIVAVYRSDTNRARDTAAPLGMALGLMPVVYTANDTTTLVSDIFAAHRGERVFVVGHSNTVPDIISAAGGPTIPDIDDGEFDNLFVLTVCRCRRGLAELVNLQYGAASP